MILSIKPIKYLGFYLSYNLNEIYHINYIIKKATFSFYCIQKATKNIKKITTKTYFILIKSCVLSILFYCSIFLLTATKKEIKILNIFYNKILRYLCGARRHTPIDELYLFTGLTDISYYFKINAANYWNRLLHIPKTNPIYYIIENNWYKKWKNYLQNKNKKITLKTYQKRSIFWTCFKAACKYNIIETTNFNKYKYYHMFYRLNAYEKLKPPPPKNLKILQTPYNDNMNINSINNENILFVFTDGSLKNGFGGYGIYSLYNPILYIDENWVRDQKIIADLKKYVGSSYDINYIELLAVYEALKHLLFYEYKILSNMKNIYMVTDNKQVLKWISGEYKVRESYFYDIIINIYKYVNEIYKKCKTTTSLQWCKGHMFKGNEEADILAKQAVEENEYKNKTTTKTTPISISTTKNIVKKLIYREAIKNQYTKQHIISNILKKWNIFEEYGIKQLEIDINMLTKLQYSILTQLRTGHVKLNFCLHQLNHMDYYKQQYNENNGNINKYLTCNKICCLENNSGHCKYCKNSLETVQHFIMDCKKYNQQRHKFYHKSMQILFLYQLNFTLKNILFPPLNMKNQHRKHIFDLLCNFVLDCKRTYFYF